MRGQIATLSLAGVSAPPKIAEARPSGPLFLTNSRMRQCYRVGGGAVPGVVFWGVVGGVVLGGFVFPGAGVVLPGAVCGVALPGAASGVGAVGAVSGGRLVFGVVSGVGVVFGVVSGVVVSAAVAVPGGGVAVSGAGAAVAGVCVCGVGVVGCDFFGFDGVAVWATRQIAESSSQEISVALSFMEYYSSDVIFVALTRTLGLFRLSENPADPLAPLRLSGRRGREIQGLCLRLSVRFEAPVPLGSRLMPRQPALALARRGRTGGG